MPTCTINNESPFVCNVALCQLAPLHFENAIEPGNSTTFRTGAVYFTISVRIDSPTAKNRYTATERLWKGAACLSGGIVAGGALVAAAAWAIPAAGLAGSTAAAGTGGVAGASMVGKVVASGAGKLQVAKVVVQKGQAHYKKHQRKYDLALSHGKTYATKHAQSIAAGAIASTWWSRKPAKGTPVESEPTVDVVAEDTKKGADEEEELVRVLDSKLLVISVHGVYVPFKGRKLEVRMLEDGSLVLWDLDTDVQVK